MNVFTENMLFEKLHDVSDVLFLTIFDGPTFFGSCDFHSPKKATRTTSERIITTWKEKGRCFKGIKRKAMNWKQISEPTNLSLPCP